MMTGCVRVTLWMMVVAVGMTSLAYAASETYIYRKRVNYVKIVPMTKKDMQEIAANHPYLMFTIEQMQAMLLSLRLSRKLIIKKDIDAQEVFLLDEAAKFAPHVVEAFKQVNPDEKIVLSMVQKRPNFILRNDRLTLAFLWVEGNALHVRFDKIYAKLTGDYEARANNERLIREAKSVHIALEAGPGQSLSPRGPTEIELDTTYNFVQYATPLSSPVAAQGSGPVKGTPAEGASSQTAALSAPKRPVKERLEELEALKKQGFVSEAEYKEMRKSILSDL